MRRNAKDERVLLHYNGHGVPLPTTNGEVSANPQFYLRGLYMSVVLFFFGAF